MKATHASRHNIHQVTLHSLVADIHLEAPYRFVVLVAIVTFKNFLTDMSLCSATSGSDAGLEDQPAASKQDTKKSRRPKAASKSGKKRKTTEGGEAVDEAEEAGVEAVELFCLCRQPDDGREFIECDSCNQWYHCECVGVNLQVCSCSRPSSPPTLTPTPLTLET